MNLSRYIVSCISDCAARCPGGCIAGLSECKPCGAPTADETSPWAVRGAGNVFRNTECSLHSLISLVGEVYANGPLWKPPRNPSKKDGPAEAQQVRRRVAKDENEELNMILFGLDGTRGSIEEGMVLLPALHVAQFFLRCRVSHRGNLSPLSDTFGT